MVRAIEDIYEEGARASASRGSPRADPSRSGTFGLVHPRNGGAYHRPVTSRTATLDLARPRIPAARFARPARDGAFIAGLAFALLIGAGLLPFAVDAHAYWAANPLDPYSGAALADFDAYFYSPAFTQAIWPLHGCPGRSSPGCGPPAIVVAFRWLSGLWLAS